MTDNINEMTFNSLIHPQAINLNIHLLKEALERLVTENHDTKYIILFLSV